MERNKTENKTNKSTGSRYSTCAGKKEAARACRKIANNEQPIYYHLEAIERANYSPKKEK